MIDLYAAGTSNGMRARIALEECGLAYTFHPIALDKGEHKTPQFLAMNPNGQIPVIVDRDGPGGKPLTLSQSTAILMYCAEKSGKFMPKDPAARPASAAVVSARLASAVPADAWTRDAAHAWWELHQPLSGRGRPEALQKSTGSRPISALGAAAGPPSR
jgi:glutathione S-transferase